MKNNKLLFGAICALLAAITVVVAIVIFRNEIADFFLTLKSKIDVKKLRHNGEYADYADM